MAWQIVNKTVNGNRYVYAKRPKRGNVPAEERFLGTADDLVAMADSFRHPPPPVVADKEFGAVAALFSVAERLHVTEELDAIFPKRNGGPSVGTYLLVGAISRCLEPVSKRATPGWYEKTILPRLLGYEAKAFASQRFWDNCHGLEPDDLERAQRVLARRAAEEFDLYTGRLLYDGTNYDTYLDTKNPSELAQRGHAKSKRSDLRVVGVAVMVTEDGHVPMFHEVFPGNRPDSVEFGAILPKLAKSAEELCHHEPEVTIVLDKGNNDSDTWERWRDTPFYFVGSLPISDYPDLAAVPLWDYEDLGDEDPELDGCLGYRSAERVWGHEYELVVTFNPELYGGQMQGIEHNIAQCRKGFNQIQDKLSRWRSGAIKTGRKPSVSGLKAQVQKILSRQYMKGLWQTEITEENGLPRLEVTFGQDALQRLQRTVLGKTIVFTDHTGWTSARIVSCYRAQWRIEEMFRSLQRPAPQLLGTRVSLD